RDSASSPAPFAWPLRSPDLTTPDNALWGFIKEQVKNTRYNRNYEQLWNTPSPCKNMPRIQMCYDMDGVNTDVFDS
ncbi:hypothetical protein C0J52_09412, partial [Blattella germanica]